MRGCGNGTMFVVRLGMMQTEPDAILARRIAEQLEGKFWGVTPGDWWVVVEGITAQKLTVLTNDPLGICFSPPELTLGLSRLRSRIMDELVAAEIVNEDGSWMPLAA